MKTLSNRILASVIYVCIILISPNYSIAQSNPSDADTSFGLGSFNDQINTTAIQADGKIIVGGDFTHYKTTPVNRIARLNVDGTLDNSFATGSGFNNEVLTIVIQPDGKILAGGVFNSFNGTTSNFLVRLNSNGTIDNSFTIGTGFTNTVLSMTLQPDGKILVGGGFTTFNGGTSNFLIRLNSDGTKDNSFVIGTGFDGYVNTVIVQPDGKILIGGNFTIFNGTTSSYIVRLNADGSNDNSFTIGTGFNNNVNTIALQPDGKILVGGKFTIFNGTTSNRIIRLNADGSNDNSFTIGTGFSNTYDYVNSISVQTDGKILAGGEFQIFNGPNSFMIVRLNSDGTKDNSFTIGNGFSSAVNVIVIQTDGKILVGGRFNVFDKSASNHFARLNSNGIIDNLFIIGNLFISEDVHKIVVQPDGKILVGGAFTSFKGTVSNYIIRLNPDGTKDNSFTIGTGFSDYINPIAIQPDGKILVGGMFTSFDGNPSARLVRLNTDGTFDNSFTVGTGFDDEVRSIVVQPDGKILVCGAFTSYKGIGENRMVRLNPDGTKDNSFNIGTGFNSYVYSIVLQPGGKVLVGGYFTTFNGTSNAYVVRLNSDGTIDNSFVLGVTLNNPVLSMTMQPDGKILIGGFFNFLARLNLNGALDNTFIWGSGFNNDIYTIVVQSDGKILVGGNFTIVNGVTSGKFVRLNTDGTIDNSFTVGTGFSGSVNTIAIQSDGKILAGGFFPSYKNISYNYIIRLRGDPIIYYNVIRGQIFTDKNNDCQYQSSTEPPIQSLVVKAMPGAFYGGSDVYGNYQVRVDTGSVSYTLTQEYNSVNSKLLVNQCAVSQTVLLSGVAKDTSSFDFADTIKTCALPNISIQKFRMRRCFRSSTVVRYWNFGNASASGVQVTIEYPPYIVPISSTPMWTSKNGSVLTYSVGTLAASSSGNISLIDSVVCGNQTITGLTQCIKASVSPASNCIAQDPAWDKSSIKVTGSCVNDSAVFFITNAGTGNMTSSHQYRVYVNDTLVFSDNFQLNSGTSFKVSYFAEGQTVRLEADQHPLHPGKSHPRATVEACGIPNPSLAVLKGLVITAPLDDLDEEVAYTCGVIVDSYDPNDKEVQPIGIGNNKQVDPGTELEYTIRFQNTGTDTAYTVKVVDTLDVNLDQTSFIEGASSHPYTLNVSGKGQAVLTFTFNNINLPDSTTNLMGSNGLVSFRVTVPSFATLGTLIRNKAHIFFDYNNAVITNETEQMIDNVVSSDLSKGSKIQVGNVFTGISAGGYSMTSVKVYPNPSDGVFTVEVPEVTDQTEIRVLSITGVSLKSAKLNSTNQKINLEGVNAGVYFYEIWQQGERKYIGMLQVK